MQKERIISIWSKTKQENPLTFNITNYVTVNDCANAILAVGGSPIMADELKEVEQIARIANALTLNIGTINEAKLQSMLAAGRAANESGAPVILDPVGAGVTDFRNYAIDEILKSVKISIIRGNSSEISHICGLASNAKGVDAGEIKEDMAPIARQVAKKYNCVCGITGPTDIVSDGEAAIRIHNGVPLLSKVTGSGCMTSAILGAFAGLKIDNLSACVSAICAMGIAGEVASKEARLGDFRVGIINALGELEKHINRINIKAD